MKKYYNDSEFGMVKRRLNICMIAVVIVGLVYPSCSRYFDSRIESPVIEGGKVTFRFRCEAARTVQVAGDWNNWGAGDAEQGEVLVGLMVRTGKNGTWEMSIELPPGNYMYYFLINERERELDPFNPRIIDDTGGGKASLLILP